MTIFILILALICMIALILIVHYKYKRNIDKIKKELASTFAHQQSSTKPEAIEENSQLNTHTVSASSTPNTHPLSGLPSEIEAILKLNILIHERSNSQTPFGVLMFGIDHFKDISLTLGHFETNRLVKDVGRFLKENSTNMFLYHLSCEKFLLILPKFFDTTGEMNLFARDFLTLFSNTKITHQNIHLSGSLGIAKYPDDGNIPTKLIDSAFTALSKAQENKESNFEVYISSFEKLHDGEIKMNDEIISGLKNREFILHYQPIFDLNSDKIVGIEVLLRWDHPQHGLISPDKFLHIAEQTGLMINIGEYVFEETIKQKKSWNEMGMEQLVLTINLSVREMRIESLILKLEKYLSLYNILPSEVNLDITEEAVMLHHDETQRDIKLFSDSGISLTLDRFGSGLFSISYLQNLPLDKLKLDRSLTTDLENNEEHRKTVKSIIALAHSLGLEVAAEGVESEKMIEVLKDIGCKYAQGYYYSQPMDAADFVNYYEKTNR